MLSSLVETVLSGALGALFTLTTLSVIVLATRLVSTPPLAVPPLSWTLKVKNGLAMLPSFASAAGLNVSWARLPAVTVSGKVV